MRRPLNGDELRPERSEGAPAPADPKVGGGEASRGEGW